MADKRSDARKGLFVVIDGLDGIGKGIAERALIEYDQKLDRHTFDAVSFSKAESKGLPELEDFWNPPIRHYHTIITAEPTYAGIGKDIRNEIIAKKNKGRYSAATEVYMYSLDRLIQMNRVIIPALLNNLNVIQDRSCASTLTYQALRAREEGKSIEDAHDFILQQEGNKLQLEWAPDLLIIPLIDDVAKVVARLEERKAIRKDDKSIFDNIEFQEKLKPYYEDNWLRELFEKHGTHVVYFDAGISEEETRHQAVEIYRKFLANIRKNL